MSRANLWAPPSQMRPRPGRLSGRQGGGGDAPIAAAQVCRPPVPAAGADALGAGQTGGRLVASSATRSADSRRRKLKFALCGFGNLLTKPFMTSRAGCVPHTSNGTNLHYAHNLLYSVQRALAPGRCVCVCVCGQPGNRPASRPFGCLASLGQPRPASASLGRPASESHSGARNSRRLRPPQAGEPANAIYHQASETTERD